MAPADEPRELATHADAPLTTVASEAPRAVQHGAYSALLPGLGQVAQRRYRAAVLQFGTVVAYVAVAVATGNPAAAWLAFAWNAWSSIDAYLYADD